MQETLTTDRLFLRRWREADRLPFQAMNADPPVMEFFPGVLSGPESDGLVDRIERHFEQYGFGPFAAELLESKRFIGYIGLAVPQFDAPFMHEPGSARTADGRWDGAEIGWRLAADFWGRGLATEGARAVLSYAVERLAIPSIVSFAATQNRRSRRVMKKIGLVHDPAGDFDHPSLAEGHPLRRHVLYRLERTGARPPGWTQCSGG
jgi:ribosomal-protein-alanine N-acetyltransferase